LRFNFWGWGYVQTKPVKMENFMRDLTGICYSKSSNKKLWKSLAEANTSEVLQLHPPSICQVKFQASKADVLVHTMRGKIDVVDSSLQPSLKHNT
jgi:hypothetical protein